MNFDMTYNYSNVYRLLQLEIIKSAVTVNCILSQCLKLKQMFIKKFLQYKF